ncbi:MAG: SpoIIE family protein phosphatase [Cyclonatronaceae bacterium]
MSVRYTFQVFAVVLLLVLAAAAPASQFDARVEVSLNSLDNPYRVIPLPNSWNYAPGDNPEWRLPDLDDTGWEQISTSVTVNDLQFAEWTGIGWFRLTIDADSSIVGYPLSLEVISQNGAAEIYLNGEQLYEFGKVGLNPKEEHTHHERKPRVFTLKHPGKHVLAVRYSSQNYEYYHERGLHAGFRYILQDANHHIDTSFEQTRVFTIYQAFFSGILIVFCVVHLLLYLFYRRKRENLYYALFTGSFAVLNFLNYQIGFAITGSQVISLLQFQLLFRAATIIYFMRFAYALFYEFVPKQFWIFTFVMVSDAVYRAFFSLGAPVYSEIIMDFILLAFYVEIIRVVVLAVVRKKEGAWIFGFGIALFTTCQALIMLINYDILTGIQELYGLTGTIGLLLAMSVSLSRSVALTNQRLASKLVEVRELSKKAIEQERLSQQQEMDRKLLELDNRRKTQELEEARKLQFSMLPAKIPNLNGYEVAFHMTTATEVGGDYYDFSKNSNGSLTVALGDATGHGLKAGMVVATAKSYFQTFAGECGNLDLLQKISVGIKNMNLRMLYMSMTLLRLEYDHIKIASAGMPPALVYRGKTGEINQIILKGLPLGSKPDYPYSEQMIYMEEGDTILVFSDGLPEAFNRQRKMLETERIVEVMGKSSSLSTQELIKNLVSMVSSWTESESLHDDITIAVIRKTNKHMSDDDYATSKEQIRMIPELKS